MSNQYGIAQNIEVDGGMVENPIWKDFLVSDDYFELYNNNRTNPDLAGDDWVNTVMNMFQNGYDNPPKSSDDSSWVDNFEPK